MFPVDRYEINIDSKFFVILYALALEAGVLEYCKAKVIEKKFLRNCWGSISNRSLMLCSNSTWNRNKVLEQRLDQS